MNESLDLLDRKILEVVCSHHREGQSFNKLVEEVKPLASRSTFALRAKRLEKLGYIEKISDTKQKQIKRIRGTPIVLLASRLLERIREQCGEAVQDLKCKKEFILSKKDQEYTDKEFSELKESILQLGERIKEIFSLVGTYAVLLGEPIAGDLLLPKLVEDFKKLNSELLSLLSLDKRVMDSLAREKLSVVPFDTLNEDFEYAFGEPVGTALPKFSQSLERITKK